MAKDRGGARVSANPAPRTAAPQEARQGERERERGAARRTVDPVHAAGVGAPLLLVLLLGHAHGGGRGGGSSPSRGGRRSEERSRERDCRASLRRALLRLARRKSTADGRATAAGERIAGEEDNGAEAAKEEEEEEEEGQLIDARTCERPATPGALSCGAEKRRCPATRHGLLACLQPRACGPEGTKQRRRRGGVWRLERACATRGHRVPTPNPL